MKGPSVVAAVAALAGSVTAAGHRGHRHAHELFQKRGGSEELCVPACKTYYTTIYGEPTLIHNTPTAKPMPSTNTTCLTTAPPKPTTTGPITVPTPIPQTCPTPGTYTFPATTVVVTETTTVCAASTTKVPSGTHTLGGVTTVVTTATTVTCPYATTETKPNGDVTSVIKTTTYVCPSAGTYTIAPVTATVTATETVVIVPVVTTYCPGTYTAPAVVTTVTETNVVVYCPFTSPAPAPTVTATPISAPVENKPVPTLAPVEDKPVPTSQMPSSPAPTTPSLGGGKQWAMTYTPYTSGGFCKTKAEVMEDIKNIKNAGFTTVRVYSTDCDTLPNVGEACSTYGVKMIIGVFIGSVGCDNGNPHVSDQIAAIKAWAKWDLVEMVIVGNEALFNGYCTPFQLKSLIEQVRTVVREGGCNAPVTTTDTVSGWQISGVAEAICSVVDVVACNVHPYFNGAVQPSEAGSFVKSQLSIVETMCGGKKGYAMETGWPHAGNCIGSSCAGPAEQATAIGSIKEVVGGECVFFSWTDDAWKKPGDCNCENSWGCGALFSS